MKSQLYSDIDYFYENATVHIQGLGFCGFSKIKSYDNIRNRESVQTYDPYRFGVMTGDENIASKTVNMYDTIIQPDKRTQILLTSQTVQDRIRGITQTVSYTHDSYGHPAVETFNFGDNIVQTTSNIYYHNTGTPYILGALTDQTVTVTRSGASNSRRMYVSSHSHGIPLTSITYANGNQTSESLYTYNAMGCLTSDTVKRFASTDKLVTEMQYDTYGRMIRETNPLGLNTTFEYHPLTGVLERTRDHKLQATVYTYDNLWRRMAADYPGGVFEHNFLEWSTGAGLYRLTTMASNEPHTYSYFDAFGRNVRNSVMRFDNAVLNTDTEYDSYGRAYRESLPFTGSAATFWNTVTSFDGFDRPGTVACASGKNTTHVYNGKDVTTVGNGISTTYCYDAQGNLTSVTDPAGTVTCHLRPDGQPSSIEAPGNITTTFAYDSYGRQEGINDPSAGNRTFEYDAAGNLYLVTDADNRVKTMYYDRYGRITSKALPEFTTVYKYNGDGLPDTVISTNGTSHTFQYNTYGKLYVDRENAPDGKWLERTYAYQGNKVIEINYNTSAGPIGNESYLYSNGQLSEIRLGSTEIWKLTGENAMGLPVTVLTGSVTGTYSYDAYGMPDGRSASTALSGTFQHLAYGFDPLKGNLNSRKDNTRNIQENFTYDGLNRLKTFAGFNMEYDAKGNITEKSDAGNTFYYNTPNKPYAISGVDAGTNTAIPFRNQTVTHTSFDRPAGITENGYEALFTYSGSGSRKKMELKLNGASVLQRYYLGGSRYEYDATPAGNMERLFIGGDAYTAPAVYISLGSGWQLYYICRDHLGSITHLISERGGINSEHSYDAWGRLRDPVTQTAYTPGTEPNLLLGRGYTGHEHLPWFGLINMNARLYDPAIGQFLSPDRYIADPANSLDFNRFMYARNNPLIYTDPNGEFLGLAAAGLMFFGDLLSNLVTGTSRPVKTAWRNASNMYNGMSNVLQFPIYTDKNNRITGGLDPFALGVSIKGTHRVNDNITVGGSVGYGLFQGPFGNFGGAYNFNDHLSVGFGFGGGRNYWGWNASATYDGIGAGYGRTHYGSAIGPDGISNAQTVGSASILWRGGSFTLQNDVKYLGGDREDRWRTNAWELTIGNISVGNYIYTNQGSRDGGGPNESLLSPIWGKNRNDGFSAWSNGRVYSSPLWIGIRTGNTMQRVGYSFRGAQDLFQNGIHTTFGKQHYYLNYQYFRTGLYLFTGYYNPFSLWGY